MAETAPIPMILTCPACGGRHIDKGAFATKPHHTHACQHCGLAWRPAIVATVGVQFLPGFREVMTADALMVAAAAVLETRDRWLRHVEAGERTIDPLVWSEHIAAIKWMKKVLESQQTP